MRSAALAAVLNAVASATRTFRVKRSVLGAWRARGNLRVSVWSSEWQAFYSLVATPRRGRAPRLEHEALGRDRVLQRCNAGFEQSGRAVCAVAHGGDELRFHHRRF